MYDMQSIIYITDDVKRFGALDNFSAFAFENELGHLKKAFAQWKGSPKATVLSSG